MKFALCVFTVAAALAQEPRITNARLDTKPVSGGLEASMRRLTDAATGPEWAGYSIPAVPGNRSNWCSNSGVVRLEGSSVLLILFRLADHAVEKIQVSSTDCEVDAGGLPFHLFTGVAAAESVAYLASLATRERHVVMAIAMHDTPEADRALENMGEDAAFWLGSARGKRGVEILKRMLERDSSDRVREKVVFALSVSKEPAATQLLIDSARSDKSSHIRSKALFWLAHKAGKKEAAVISRAVEEDPDAKVKKQAVFALKQLPPDEGIPLLIHVAHTNTNPEVRKQAMFWLGQSNDARAVKFFEELLAK